MKLGDVLHRYLFLHRIFDTDTQPTSAFTRRQAGEPKPVIRFRNYSNLSILQILFALNWH